MVNGFIRNEEYFLFSLEDISMVKSDKNSYIALDATREAELVAIFENRNLLEKGRALWTELEEWPEGVFPSAGVSGNIVIEEVVVSDESFSLIPTEGGWGLYNAAYGTIYLPKDCMVPVKGRFIYYLVSNTLQFIVNRDGSCHEGNNQ